MTDEKNNKLKSEELFLYIISIIFLGIFIYTIYPIITPIVSFILILVISYPLRKRKPFNYILKVSGILIFLWLLYILKAVLVPFIIAFILSYLFNPLVTKLEGIKINRSISIVFILIITLSLIILLMALILPPFFNQVSTLISTIPQLVAGFQIWLQNDFIIFLEKIGMPKENVEVFINQTIIPKLEKSLENIFTSIFKIFSGLGIILGQLINLIIIPILTFYTLKDFDKIKFQIKKLIPSEQKENVEDVVEKFDSIIGKYIRGALTIALINATIITTALSLIGVNYSLVLGILSGIMSLIPYFGIFISLGTGLIIGLISGLSAGSMLLIPVIYLAENILETSILFPKIVGRSVGLHPLILILSISVFAYFFGLIGMLIAVPCASVLVLIYKEKSSTGSIPEMEL